MKIFYASIRSYNFLKTRTFKLKLGINKSDTNEQIKIADMSGKRLRKNHRNE